MRCCSWRLCVMHVCGRTTSRRDLMCWATGRQGCRLSFQLLLTHGWINPTCSDRYTCPLHVSDWIRYLDFAKVQLTTLFTKTPDRLVNLRQPVFVLKAALVTSGMCYRFRRCMCSETATNCYNQRNDELVLLISPQHLCRSLSEFISSKWASSKTIMRMTRLNQTRALFLCLSSTLFIKHLTEQASTILQLSRSVLQ